MIKDMIKTINHALANDEMTIACAYELLKSLTLLTGKEYMILRMRVIYKENGSFHDAWANA